MAVDEEFKDELIRDVAKNTADINRLTQTVQDLAKTVNQQGIQTSEAIGALAKQQSDSHQELLRHINKQEVNVAYSQKTNWQTIAGIGGVFVAILALFMTLMTVIGSMAMTPIETDLNELKAKDTRTEQRIDDAMVEIGELKSERKIFYLLIDQAMKDAGGSGINIIIQ
jgi:cell division protein FtsL